MQITKAGSSIKPPIRTPATPERPTHPLQCYLSFVVCPPPIWAMPFFSVTPQPPCQQPRVMLFESPIGMHMAPPSLSVRVQMRRCFEYRVFHLDSDVSKATLAPLRSPLQARPHGGPPGGQSVRTFTHKPTG